ncbi:MAG: hypothetical protein RL308_3537 [Bacteroidota bacterium]|jgi:hypothetical protein
MNLNKKDIQAARDILKSSPKNLDLMMEIKKKRFRLSELNINPRNAVHWETKGLFLNKKSEGKWHLLDLSEATWILMLQKLRDFNFTLELINNLKENFLNERIKLDDNGFKDDVKSAIKLMNKENIDHILNSKAFDDFIQSMDLTLLETILMDIIHLRNEYRILFNLAGSYVLVKEGFHDNPMQEHISNFLNESHFSLSVNEIVAELLGKIDLNLAHDSYKMISKEEMQILTILRTENIESVEIRLDPISNNIEYINYTETLKIGAYQRLNQLIMRKGYQEITITTQNGRIARCDNKIKIKK